MDGRVDDGFLHANMVNFSREIDALTFPRSLTCEEREFRERDLKQPQRTQKVAIFYIYLCITEMTLQACEHEIH